MPKYRVKLADGSTFVVEVAGDQPPTEQEVMDYLAANPDAAGKNSGFVNNTPPASAENSDVVGDRRTESHPNDPSTMGMIKNFGRELLDQGRGALEAIASRSNQPGGMAMPAQPTTPSNMVNFVKERAGEYAEDPLNAIYSKPASFMAEASGVAAGAPTAGRAAMAAGTKTAAAARGASGVAGAAAKGALKQAPIVGPMTRGAMNEVAKYKKNKAASRPTQVKLESAADAAKSKNAGGKLGGRAPILEDEIGGALNELMGVGDEPMKVGLTPEPSQTRVGGKPSVDAGRYDEMQGSSSPDPDNTTVEAQGPPQLSSTREFEAGEAADREWADAQPPAMPRIMNDGFDDMRAAGHSEETIERVKQIRTQPIDNFRQESIDAGRASDHRRGDLEAIFEHPSPAPEAFRSTEPTPWHSGEEPGSPEAAQAAGIHREEAIMDQFYRMMLDDPRK